jgi:hypothetical protein
MSRVIIGAFTATICMWIAGCCLFDNFDSTFWTLLAIDAVVGGLIGAVASSCKASPIFFGPFVGLFGVACGLILFLPKEGGWTVAIWIFGAAWGGIMGLLTGIVIRFVRPNRVDWN